MVSYQLVNWNEIQLLAESKLQEMDNGFSIGKPVDFNLIYLWIGTERWPVNQPFQYLLWLKAQGVVFLTGTTQCRD